MVILLSLLNSDNLEVMMALAQTMPMFSNVCTELQPKMLPSLLHSNSSAKALAIARPDFVIVYFAPLQILLALFMMIIMVVKRIKYLSSNRI